MNHKRKHRVLIVLTSLVAEGTPQLALQLARHWQHQGIDVELLCLRALPTTLRPEFNALGVPIHTAVLGSGLARYPRLAWQSFRLCQARQINAVLSFPLGWHALIAIGARTAGVPRVCAHVGNLPPVWTGNAFRKFKLLVQLGRPFTHRLLCCSNYVKTATISDFGVSPHETRTVLNACDLNQFQALSRPVAEQQRRPTRLGMVARLEAHKDQPNLIKSVGLLRDRGTPVELWLIGEGSKRADLENLISSLNLNDRIQLLGSRRDIDQLLNQLDLFIFSAKRDEGFGIALAEAMAAGVPIVATDVGACREVLDGGRCGTLVPAGDPQALATGILQVMDDPQSARQRSEAAREWAAAHYSIAAMAEAYGEELNIR